MTYEEELKERVKSVKRRIYFSAPPPEPVDPPRAADPKTFKAKQRIDKNAAWVKAMRVDRRPKIVTLNLIKRTLCKHYKISQHQLFGPWRARDVVRPRQIGMWLARELTHNSLPQIGQAFGGRDHTTVIHAINKVNQLIGEDREEISWQINVLTEAIYAEMQ